MTLSQPIRSKTKTNRDSLSRALRQQQSSASSCDWFTGLSVTSVIGQSHYFDSGFTTVEKKATRTEFLHN